jgi:hypothetical protein
MVTSLSGLRTCSLPWFLFESLNPNLISRTKILPMGISRLSGKFPIVPPNSNTLAFIILVIENYFTTASRLVGSGSFVTKWNSTKCGLASPTCYERFIPNPRTKHPPLSHLCTVLEVFSFLLSGTPLALFQMDEPGEILSQYPSLRSSFPPDPFLRTLTRIRCYSICPFLKSKRLGHLLEYTEHNESPNYGERTHQYVGRRVVTRVWPRYRGLPKYGHSA